MQKYDVVLLVDVSLSETARKEVVWEFEKLIKKNIVDHDDIGLQQLAYNLGNKAWNDKAYLYSYCIEAQPADLELIKKTLLYNKSIKRYFIFKMGKNEEFTKFKKVHEELQTIIDAWDAKKLWQKVNFFVDKRNNKYLNRKSVPMIKKYITRFGDMKPRKYTFNTVATQKKLKIVVLRSRELGLIPYTR